MTPNHDPDDAPGSASKPLPRKRSSPAGKAPVTAKTPAANRTPAGAARRRTAVAQLGVAEVPVTQPPVTQDPAIEASRATGPVQLMEPVLTPTAAAAPKAFTNPAPAAVPDISSLAPRATAAILSLVVDSPVAERTEDWVELLGAGVDGYLRAFQTTAGYLLSAQGRTTELFVDLAVAQSGHLRDLAVSYSGIARDLWS